MVTGLGVRAPQAEAGPPGIVALLRLPIRINRITDSMLPPGNLGGDQPCIRSRLILEHRVQLRRNVARRRLLARLDKHQSHRKQRALIFSERRRSLGGRNRRTTTSERHLRFGQRHVLGGCGSLVAFPLVGGDRRR